MGKIADARAVRTLVRALFTDGHILRDEQQQRFALLCVATDESIPEALAQIRELRGPGIFGKTAVRTDHIESAYRLYVQAINILADYVARGLELGIRDNSGDRAVTLWATSALSLVEHIRLTDRRWPAISNSTVRRVVSATEVMLDRGCPNGHTQLATDRRQLHSWLGHSDEAKTRGHHAHTP
jgi:hypothetical protein